MFFSYSNDQRPRHDRRRNASRSPSPQNRGRKEELEGSDGGDGPVEQRLER